MLLSQILEVVSVIVGVTAILRGVRNLSKAWDGITHSIEGLNDRLGTLVEQNKEEHTEFKKRIKRIESGNHNAL